MAVGALCLIERVGIGWIDVAFVLTSGAVVLTDVVVGPFVVLVDAHRTEEVSWSEALHTPEITKSAIVGPIAIESGLSGSISSGIGRCIGRIRCLG